MKVVAIFAALLLLGGCASDSKQVQVELGPCSSDQKVVVSDHISGQISALEKLDFKKAYTYASEDFQKSLTLEQFESVISRQYQMLISNDEYSFADCQSEIDYFIQDVIVQSLSGKTILRYRLSLVDKRLGVESAVVRAETMDLPT
jgi:uncharacterized protein (DUF1499 family)